MGKVKRTNLLFNYTYFLLVEAPRKVKNYETSRNIENNKY